MLYYSEKYIWPHNSLLYSLQCWWQVLQTSSDPDQQFSAPFKAGNSRQGQTCYKPMVQTQRKLIFSSLHRYRRNGSSHDLETLSTNSMTLAALCVQAFSLWWRLSCGIFIAVEWNTAVITQVCYCQN